MKAVLEFFGCMLKGSCEYSIKKFLAYIFTILICYLAVFTDKNYYELLLFLGALLAIRSYDKVKRKEENETNSLQRKDI